VHRGHAAMVARVRSQGVSLGLQACVLTFEPHPREYFGPQSAPARLTRLSAKLQLLREAGAQRVHVARFDAGFSSMSPERFIDEVLVRGLGCAWLLVGEDFRFGARRAGDFAMLNDFAGRAGFKVEAMPEVKQGEVRISSSAVRAALRQGDLHAAAALLGRPYAIAGRVAHGEKLGRTLGFPTANLRLPLSPALGGVFVVEVAGVPGWEGKCCPGVASLGVRPTVNQVPAPLLEVHLFDFSGDLYGRRIEVRFLAKLRDEEKYTDLSGLKAAIEDDVQRARKHFAKASGNNG